jgi:hypothetical protein
MAFPALAGTAQQVLVMLPTNGWLLIRRDISNLATPNDIIKDDINLACAKRCRDTNPPEK